MRMVILSMLMLGAVAPARADAQRPAGYPRSYDALVANARGERMVRRYDEMIVGAINIGAHVDRISTAEMVKRFLPLLKAGAEEVKARLL